MNDHSWMYRDSLKSCMRLIIVMGFIINYVLSNLRNISGGGIRCPCKRCKNKKVFRSRCYNDASSTKKVHEEIFVFVCSRKTMCSSQYHGRK